MRWPLTGAPLTIPMTLAPLDATAVIQHTNYNILWYTIIYYNQTIV